MSSLNPHPVFLTSVLALRPPLATSTRTDLAPAFKLLHSLVNTVYGSPGLRGIEPGLWLAQLARATQRAAQVVQAVWTKLGGPGGVVVDEDGDIGRGVMKLQGVLSDLQIFVGSLQSVQDPLASLLLDPAAFSRTQATVNSLIKKLVGLANHYKVADLLVTPLDKWPEEDAEDKAADLAALPLLIAKSRPTRDVLKKFEADCVQRELAESAGTQSAAAAEDEDPSESKPSSSSSAHRSTSTANSGLSAAKRADFLRFVYSQNPNLIADNTSLDTAVAAGTAAFSSLGPMPKSHSGPVSRPENSNGPRKSLVQQRISSFATSADATPPLPSALLNTTGMNRRVVSDISQASTTRKTWTVDMSGLDAIQRKSTPGVPRPSQAPQIAVAAGTPQWKTSLSRPSSIKSRSSNPDTVPELDKAPLRSSLGHSSGAPPEGPSIATFAEQAAAIVSARKTRTASQSSNASWTKARDLGSSSPNPSQVLSVTPEHPPPPSLERIDSERAVTSSPVPSAQPSVQQDDPADVTASEQPAVPVQIPSPPASQSNAVEPTQPVPPPAEVPIVVSPVVQESPLPDPPLASSPTSATELSRALTSPPRSPAPSRSFSSFGKSPSSAGSASIRAQIVPPEPQLDFDLVPDLIEHTSMIDAILAPSSVSESNTPQADLPESFSEPKPKPETVSLAPDDTRSLRPVVEPKIIGSYPSPTEETSLVDLLERASMFEHWEPSDEAEEKPEPEPEPEPEAVRKTSSSVSSTVRPGMLNGQEVGATSPLSSTLSPTLSPRIQAPLSPPSTGGSHPRSAGFPLSQSNPPMSPGPSMASLQTLDGPVGMLPTATHSAVALNVAEPASPALSFSGMSWATSLMSAPPVTPELELSMSANGGGRAGHLGVGRNPKWSLNVSTGNIPPPSDPLKAGWRILCLDGGGIRGLSMLFIVRELMTALQTQLGLRQAPLPCEVFEMICGVGTGGIIALLLGRLRLETSSAIEAYLRIVRQVFAQGKGVIAAVRRKTRFSASKLETVMREVIEQIGGHPESTLGDAGALCRTFVVAMRTSESKGGRGTLRTLRSYAGTDAMADICNIPQAARATSAAPLFFKPVQLAGDAPLESVPSDASVNNPCMEAVNEARGLYGHREMDCLVSLGAGRGGTLGTGAIARACAEMAESCENAAEAVEAMASQEGWAGKYGRFSVERLMDDTGSIRAEWDCPELVQTRTTEYLLTSGRDMFERVLGNLLKSWKRAYEGDETLEALSGGPRSSHVLNSHHLGPGMRSSNEVRRSISADERDSSGRGGLRSLLGAANRSQATLDLPGRRHWAGVGQRFKSLGPSTGGMAAASNGGKAAAAGTTEGGTDGEDTGEEGTTGKPLELPELNFD